MSAYLRMRALSALVRKYSAVSESSEKGLITKTRKTKLKSCLILISLSCFLAFPEIIGAGVFS